MIVGCWLVVSGAARGKWERDKAQGDETKEDEKKGRRGNQKEQGRWTDGEEGERGKREGEEERRREMG